MPVRPLDPADRRILDRLQRDGSVTNLELAEAVGLSPSPCLRRVRLLEEDGVIAGYAARLDRRKAGFGVMAFIFVHLDRHGGIDAETLRRAVGALPEVIGCWVASGEFDILLQVVAADLDAYRDFALGRLLGLPGVRDIRTSFVIDTVFEQRPLPIR